MNATTYRIATGLLLAAGLSVLVVPRAQAAAYATGGSGQYRNEILWLTWGGGSANGTSGVVLSNGSSTSATIPVTGSLDLQMTCSLANVSGSIESYRPGGWSGDALDDMYNIGGTGAGNQLISGIMGRSGVRNFTVNCQATLGGQPYRIPGLVVADAESMATGNEYLVGTAAGQWNVVEVFSGNGGNYGGLKTNAGGQQSIRLGLPGGEGSGTSPAAVAFLTFDDGAYAPGTQAISMNFEINGGGNTAIAIGLLTPAADFGDAPASYGGASHLLRGLVAVPDNLVPGVGTNLNGASFVPGQLAPPDSGFLGTTGADGEPTSQAGVNADGDDNDGSAGPREEDAWPFGGTLVITQVAQQVAGSIACAGTGAVSGWVDFDRNGAFDAGERSQAPCSGGAAALSWTVPADVSGGRSYARLRYASDAADVQSPTGEAPDGEVEDHAIDIELAVDVSLVKNVTPDSAMAGQDVVYTLDIGNAGPFAADGAVITDPPVAGLDCPAAAAVACTPANGAQCPAAPITVGDLQGAGLVVPALPVDGTLVLEYTCTVE